MTARRRRDRVNRDGTYGRRPHRSPGSTQHMFPTCRICGNRYRGGDYAGHTLTDRHRKAVRS